MPLPRVSPIYRAGLAGLVITLFLLQLAYVAMVVLSAAATAYYVWLLPGILSAVRVNFITLPLVLAPVAAGSVVTFFLMKPLLSRPPRLQDDPLLTPLDAPLLFTLVARICDVIGAPKPVEIRANLEVNASARLRGWKNLFTNELVLTVGLPLAGELSLRQFAGVLAHEFGHFAQTGGMRSQYLIGSIRMWFTRVAYERDAWDDRLDQWKNSESRRINLVFTIAQLAVDLSRWILRGLLRAADFVSAWFSRQMEFDADLYEAGLVGEAAFKDTMLRLPVLAVAGQAAWREVDLGWNVRRMAGDYPGLFRCCHRALPPEAVKAIEEEELNAETGRWHRHPAAVDRIRNVQGIQGLLQDPWDEPASVLFADFPAVSKRITRVHYEKELGGKLSEASMLDADIVHAETARKRQEEEARASVFGRTEIPSRWFRLYDPSPDDSTDRAMVVCFDDVASTYWTVLDESLNRNAGLELVKARTRIHAPAFHLTSGEAEDVRKEAEHSRRQLGEEINRLREMFAGNGEVYRRTASRSLVSAYEALSAEQDAFLDLRHDVAALRVMRANLQHIPAAEAANALDRIGRRIDTQTIAVMERLKAALSVLADDGATIVDLAEDILKDQGESTGEMSPDERAMLLLSRSDIIADALLGRICMAFLDAVESAKPAASTGESQLRM